jgi:hypothetical protein
MPTDQVERMVKRQRDIMGEGKRRKRSRSSLWRERDAKRVCTDWLVVGWDEEGAV